MLRYKVSEDLRPERFLSVGNAVAAALESALQSAGASFGSMTSVLDFGAGCGRTVRWLIERFPETRFYGTDVDDAAIQWCREHLRGCFAVNCASPPLAFPDGFFDCVFAVSVFTHLEEEDQLHWLGELRRIVRDGGWFAASVHGPGAAQRLSSEDAVELNVRGILTKNSRKLDGIHPPMYQTTFHARAYTLSVWSRYFTVIRYIDGGLGAQDLVLCRKESVKGDEASP